MIDSAGVMLTAAMIGVSARQIGLSRGIGLILGLVTGALSLGLLFLFRDLGEFPSKSADLGQTLTACIISGVIMAGLVWALRPLHGHHISAHTRKRP